MHPIKRIRVKCLGRLLVHGSLEVHSVRSCHLLALSAHGEMVESAWMLLIVDELKGVVVPGSTESSSSLIRDLHALSNILILVAELPV